MKPTFVTRLVLTVCLAVSAIAVVPATGFRPESLSETKWGVYHAMVASGDTVIAVGDLGGIVRSLDGGANWHPIISPTRSPLYSVARSGTHFIAAGASGVVVVSDDNGLTWRHVMPKELMWNELRSIFPLAESETYIVGDGVIYLYDGQRLLVANDILPVFPLSISRLAGGDVYLVGKDGDIYVRTPQTRQWNFVRRISAPYLLDVWFADSLRAVATRGGSQFVGLYATSDGWRTATPVDLNSYEGVNSKLFSLGSGAVGIVTRDLKTFKNGFLVSTDSGRTWQHKPIIRQGSFENTSSAAALDNRAIVYSTTFGTLGRVADIRENNMSDNGVLAGVTTTQFLHASPWINFGPRGEAYAVSPLFAGGFGVSPDTGRTWTRLAFPTTMPVRSITASAKRIFLATEYQHIWSMNFDGSGGMKSPGQIRPPVQNSEPLIFDETGQRAYYVNVDVFERPTKFYVRQTLDGGDTWTEIDSAEIPESGRQFRETTVEPFGRGYVLKRNDYSRGAGYPLSRHEYVFSDPGQTKAVNIIESDSIGGPNIHFACNRSTAILARSKDSTGRITFDGGETWSNIPLPCLGSAIVGRVFEIKPGFLVAGSFYGSSLQLHASTDGGQTWFSDLLIAGPRTKLNVANVIQTWYIAESASFVFAFREEANALLRVPLTQYPNLRPNLVSASEQSSPTSVDSPRLTLSPSPAQSDLLVSLHGLSNPLGRPVSLTLHDMNGALVADWSAVARASISGPDATFRVSLPSEAAAGVYIVRLLSDQVLTAVKLLVIR